MEAADRVLVLAGGRLIEEGTPAELKARGGAFAAMLGEFGRRRCGVRDLFRLLGLYRRHVGWILLSMLVSLVATLANVGLMATSGWFITAMAAAGLTGMAMNYFTPAAIIRGLAILRTGGRYIDRVVGHEATLRLLADTRAHLFARMVPLAPAALDDLRSGDLLARLKADIDRLELTFLRFLSPLAVALLTLIAVGLVLFLQDGALSAGVLAVLTGCGLLAPALAAAAAAGPGRTLTARSADLRRLVVDDLSGLMPLIVTGAFSDHRERLVGTMASLVQAERRLARRASFGQALGRLSGDLALIVALAIGVPLVAPVAWPVRISPWRRFFPCRQPRCSWGCRQLFLACPRHLPRQDGCLPSSIVRLQSVSKRIQSGCPKGAIFTSMA